MKVLLIYLIIGSILTGILNRLRGTGVIKHFGTLRIQKYRFMIFKKEIVIPNISIEIKLVWNHIYGLYFAVIFGYLTGSIGVGLLALAGYLVGESKGWGEWVGALVRTEPKTQEWLQKQYKDNEGVGFPYIHQITNKLIPEQIEGTFEDKLNQYNKYATLALTFRGIFWFLPMIIFAIYLGLLSWYIGIISLILVGIGFPFACWLGKKITFTKKFGILEFRQGWENQEFIYGIIHFLVIILPIILGL